MGRVVHVRRDPYEAYVGRGGPEGSRWGNPFRIGDAHPRTGEPIARGDGVELYKEWILRGGGRWLLCHLGELEGRTLGCWCAPKGGLTEHDRLVCHGQVLLTLLAWRRKKISEKKRRRRA